MSDPVIADTNRHYAEQDAKLSTEDMISQLASDELHSNLDALHDAFYDLEMDSEEATTSLLKEMLFASIRYGVSSRQFLSIQDSLKQKLFEKIREKVEKRYV